jgi:DNA-binding PadR family transcriptional regulator
MTDPTSLLPLHPRDYLILFTLAEGERHGYGIVKEVARLTDGLTPLDPANLYRSMKRLIRDGMVVEADKRPAPDANDERRRYYTITEFGTRVVAAEAARLGKLTDAARAKKLIPGSERPA